MKNKKVLLIGVVFGLITLGALLLRFWNYERVVNFHLDPPLFLHEVKEMVDSRKIRLIGPLVATKVIEGRYFFTGPTFYWLLAILGIALNWNVIGMTGFFALYWIGTFILIFYWLKRRFGYLVALLIYALVSFIPFLVPYSRIIWNVNLVPFFGCAVKFRRNLLQGVSFLHGIFLNHGIYLLCCA